MRWDTIRTNSKYNCRRFFILSFIILLSGCILEPNINIPVEDKYSIEDDGRYAFKANIDGIEFFVTEQGYKCIDEFLYELDINNEPTILIEGTDGLADTCNHWNWFSMYHFSDWTKEIYGNK